MNTSTTVLIACLALVTPAQADSELEGFVFYQQLNDGAELCVYRQRSLVLSIGATGETLQNAYSLNENVLRRVKEESR